MSVRRVAVPDDADRIRISEFIRERAASGELSAAERDNRIEAVFRARSVPELEALVADLQGATQVRSDMVFASATRAQREEEDEGWLRRTFIWTGCGLAIGIAIWAATGGGLQWLGLLFVTSGVAFLLRLRRRGKRGRQVRALRRSL